MAHLDPSAAALQIGLASELRRIRLELETLAEVLVGDTYFATLYLDKLQVFDFLGQCADETAAVLDRLAIGVDAEAAASHVRLGVMLERLRERMAAPNAAAPPTPAQAA